MEGAFCANFGQPVIGLPLCHRAWCTACYQQRPGTSLLVYHGSDPETAPNPNEEKFYLQARAGDSTCCPFECDEYFFFRITGSTSQHELLQNQTILDLIRRANLDAFWSRALRTVRELRRMFYADLKLGETLGFTMFPEPPGPFPTQYDGGMRAAIGILHRTNLAGRHEARHKYSSARKAQSVQANIYIAHAGGGATAQAIRSVRGHRAIACAPTDSEWFSHFMTGLKSRIGERRKQDAAIFIALMVEIKRRLELEWQLATRLMNKDRERAAAEHGSFHVLTYCGSFRGFETPNVVLHDLIHQTLSPEEALEAGSRGNKTPPYVSLPLKGRFKARS
jgi:hypothetical protein